jgi:hypothetical protein
MDTILGEDGPVERIFCGGAADDGGGAAGDLA